MADHLTPYTDMLHTAEAMSLRDYFAAHAPAVPDWFEPTMPEAPKHPALESADAWGLTDDQRELARQWRLDPHWDADETDSALLPFCEAFRDYWDASAGFQDEKTRQRLAQWPWFYADMVLANREVK